MKYSKTVLIVFLFLLSVVYAQPDVMMIPVANQSEHTVAAIDENNLLLIYSSRNTDEKVDSLFLIKSTDAGMSWSSPVLIKTLPIISINQPLCPSAYRLSSGRILLGWSVFSEGIYTSYSDDNALTWSEPALLLGPGIGIAIKQSFYPQFSEKPNGEVYLSYVNASKTIASYRRSFDQGESWESDLTEYLKRTLQNPLWLYDAGLLAFDDNILITVYEATYSLSPPLRNIYVKQSMDNGNTWSDSIVIAGSNKNESRPRIVKTNDNTLWIIYQVEDTLRLDQTNTLPNNIFYVKSTDSGVSWSDPQQLTKYLRDDSFISASRFTDKPFLTFRTQRFVNHSSSLLGYTFAFMIPEVTVEQYTPPVILNYNFLTFAGLKDTSIIFTVKAVDDDDISKVYLSLTDGTYLELFDDGNHNDGEAGDSIYGNIVLLSDFRNNQKAGMIVNKLKLPLDNTGRIANVTLERSFADSLIVEDNLQNQAIRAHDFFVRSSGSEYEESGIIYSGGFLLSGYTNGILWANGQASSSLIENYKPGTVGSDPLDPKNILYSVNTNDAPFGSSWQNWREAVSLGADFYDGDGDGIYNPVDFNNNGIWDPNEDMPDLIGDKTIWCVFNDAQTDRLRFVGIEPQGIEIQQTVFASSLPELENVVFFRYRIINRGTAAEKLDSVIISVWSDPDIGASYFTDLAGCDTSLQSSFIYKSTADEPNGYGENPPALFKTLLQGPVVSGDISDTARINRGPQIGYELLPAYKNIAVLSSVNFMRSDPTRGEPLNEIQARNYMRGLLPNGNILDPCTDVTGSIQGNVSCSEINSHFWYSGDPVSNLGWINNRSTDHRLMLSVGPFDLVKDEPVEIIFAYVAGRGTDRLNSITVARDNVQKAIDEYLSNFGSLAYKPGEPTYVIDNYELFQNYPNPFNPFTTIRYDLLEDGLVTLKVFDILGQEVKTLVNSVQTARRYEVQLYSEGLASGVYIYRLQINDFSQSKKMIILK
jgi:hypothetical protein